MNTAGMGAYALATTLNVGLCFIYSFISQNTSLRNLIKVMGLVGLLTVFMVGLVYVTAETPGSAPHRSGHREGVTGLSL
ncbi:MAG: hypothetical protein K2Q10_07770 [Rhodospirillales bacterium]|nr:hypothetical protein [Rhodospirillales bacterium]